MGSPRSSSVSPRTGKSWSAERTPLRVAPKPKRPNQNARAKTPTENDCRQVASRHTMRPLTEETPRKKPSPWMSGKFVFFQSFFLFFLSSPVVLFHPGAGVVVSSACGPTVQTPRGGSRAMQSKAKYHRTSIRGSQMTPAKHPNSEIGRQVARRRTARLKISASRLKEQFRSKRTLP